MAASEEVQGSTRKMESAVKETEGVAAKMEGRHYRCHACGVTRSKRSLIVVHMRRHHPLNPAEFSVVGKDSRRYECSVCGASRSKLSLLRKHTLIVHASVQSTDQSAASEDVPSTETHHLPMTGMKKRKLFECSDCGRRVKKASQLQQHLLTHSAERPYMCPKDGCRKCYKRIDHLNRHLLQHEQKGHLCPRPGCIMVCSNTSNLLRHLRNHDEKGDLQRGRLATEKILMCPEPGCDLTFEYPCRLQSHQDTVHGFQAEFLCGEPGCGATFSKAVSLLEHIRGAHRTITCQVCGKSLSRKSFGRHLMGHETSQEKKRLFCPLDGCVHSFANSYNLSVHIRVCHKKRKEYCCTFDGCDRAFGYRHTRDNHEKTRSHCYFESDFVKEDCKFQSRPRGGRKPVTLQKVEDLFRKRVVSPKEV